MKIPVYNSEGKKIKDLELSEDVFGLEQNADLLHQVYVTLAANQRQVLSHTKDMSEVRGSGRKLWKQKGTGSARVGQIRSPLWRKGGIIFGPTKDKNYKKDINKKMKRKATLIALSEKVKSEKMIIVDEIKLKENKTKEFSTLINNLKIKGSLLIGFSKQESSQSRASRNLENTSNILTSNLNVLDILNNKFLLLSLESIKFLEDKYKKKQVE